MSKNRPVNSAHALAICQGAVQPTGKGRAAFFGEAAMFSAQLAGAEKDHLGMNAPGAEANFRFTLNLLHWLARTL